MMIYSKALLALCAVTRATAFVVKAPQAPSTQLASSNDRLSGNTVTNLVPASPASLANNIGPLNGDAQLTKEVMDGFDQTLVQGESLKTFMTNTQRVQVMLNTDGRPMNSKIELWYGPDYTPFKLQIYAEDGNESPFNAVLETPYANTVAVFNTGNMEFPISTCVQADQNNGLAEVKERLYATSNPHTIQGGALKTYPLEPEVKSTQILLQTDGRHLQARIELSQGPNNPKQVCEVYSSDGKKRPFFGVFETPNSGFVVRVKNLCTVEYPLTACVEPYLVDNY